MKKSVGLGRLEQVHLVGYTVFIIGVIGFVVNPGRNQMVYILSQELMQLASAQVVQATGYTFDDSLGSLITLLILPLAGAESAICLSYQIALAPKRNIYF